LKSAKALPPSHPKRNETKNNEKRCIYATTPAGFTSETKQKTTLVLTSRNKTIDLSRFVLFFFFSGFECHPTTVTNAVENEFKRLMTMADEKFRDAKGTSNSSIGY
jgi:hypothetical protein